MFVYCAAANLHSLVNNNNNTIRQLYSNKMLVKSIYLGVQHRQLNKALAIAGILMILHEVINLLTPFLQVY